jgi:hypothetical protein
MSIPSHFVFCILFRKIKVNMNAEQKQMEWTMLTKRGAQSAGCEEAIEYIAEYVGHLPV